MDYQPATLLLFLFSYAPEGDVFQIGTKESHCIGFASK